MPYINGVRVTQAEWQAENGTPLTTLATSENGENPGGDAPVELEEGTIIPKQSKKAGNARSKVSAASVDAAVADALGE